MKQKEVKISYLTAHLTSIVSVTLVLLLVGIIAIMMVGATNITRHLEEKVEVNLILADSISDSRANQLAHTINALPYSTRVAVTGKDQAARNWQADMGEDLVSVFGVNPLSAEISFSLRHNYTSADSIAKLRTELQAIPGVEGVSTPGIEMLDSMRQNIDRITVILAIIAAAMLLISFGLINNTVHLTIYSRRFSIHTMQLVGATNGFIRRPLVTSNLLCGLIAGLVASGVIALSLAAAPRWGITDMARYIPWTAYGCIAGGITLLGMLLCSAAAWIAASRYLRKDYSQLFK